MVCVNTLVKDRKMDDSMLKKPCKAVVTYYFERDYIMEQKGCALVSCSYHQQLQLLLGIARYVLMKSGI